jgi:hypothetical protein
VLEILEKGEEGKVFNVVVDDDSSRRQFFSFQTCY